MSHARHQVVPCPPSREREDGSSVQSPDRIACSGEIFVGSIPLQEQIQALRDDNVALTAALAAATDALPAQAERAQRAEAALQARLEDARTGSAAAQERVQEARRERDFFMTQSTEAAAHAATAVGDRDAALQVGAPVLGPVQLTPI